MAASQQTWSPPSGETIAEVLVLNPIEWCLIHVNDNVLIVCLREQLEKYGMNLDEMCLVDSTQCQV